MKVTLQNGWKGTSPTIRNMNMIALVLHSERYCNRTKYELHLWLLNFGLHIES